MTGLPPTLEQQRELPLGRRVLASLIGIRVRPYVSASRSPRAGTQAVETGRGRRPVAMSRWEGTQKILVVVLVVGVVYLLAQLLGADEWNRPWQLVLSVLCGGTALIVQFLVSFAKQMEVVETSLDKRFADMNTATKLFSEVEKLRGDGVPRLAEHTTKVVTVGPGILHGFALAEIDRLAAQMEDLTNLSTECPGENHDWLMTLTRCARNSIDSINTSPADEVFWNTEAAGRYLTAQREAITERGIRIRRLFVVSRRDELAAIDPLRAEQQALGVDVRVVALETLPLHYRRGRMIDFIVFDGALSYELHPDQLGVISSTRINARAHEVQPLIRRFDQLWEAAQADTPDTAFNSARARTGSAFPDVGT
ncbi:DUF6879 family protein [Streptomyces griseus]|uniref:DUF6879 family protein n=1 Tax=Streptomyces griseus TaxID=1911 RepID=UPI0007C79A90|nr:DUF6879 family protein [Streptomyces griseus]